MNDIERIHLAKVPFNIEAEAKSRLEAYSKALEHYLADEEVLMDVEQRMTEILRERNIQADGVITLADVVAIEEQLGAPEAFADESHIDEQRLLPSRLFRDQQHGILGGVAAGLAAFMKIPVIWVRLVMLLAGLASFGVASLIYVVLWIVIPPVRTASDRLQLEGRPVTLPELRSASQALSRVDGVGLVSGRIVTMLLGIALTLGALGALALTVGGAFVFLFHDAFKEGFYGVGGHELMYGLAGLFGLSGVLLASLLSAWAYAAFSQRWNQRLTVVSLVIVLVGLLSFGSAVGVAIGVSRQEAHYVNDHTATTPVVVENLASVTRMMVDVPGVIVTYTVDPTETKATLSAFSDENHRRPVVQARVVDGELRITSPGEVAACNVIFCQDPVVNISGPELKQIDLKSGYPAYVGQQQAELSIVIDGYHSLVLRSGSVGKLSVTAEEGAVLDAEGANIETVSITNHGVADERFGTVRDLTISNIMSCPVHRQSTVRVAGVSGQLLVNGQAVKPVSVQLPCLDFQLGTHE